MKKTIILNKECFSVLGAASKDATRPNLGGVYVTQEAVFATNGHLAIQVTQANTHKPDDMDVNWTLAKDNVQEHFLVPLETAQTIAKQIPKNTYPIAQNAFVAVDETHTLRTCVNSAKSELKIEQYDLPPLESVMLPKADDTRQDVRVVRLNPKYLETLAKAAQLFANGDKTLGIDLEIRDSATQVMFRMTNDKGQEFTGILMPMKRG